VVTSGERNGKKVSTSNTRIPEKAKGGGGGGKRAEYVIKEDHWSQRGQRPEEKKKLASIERMNSSS